METYFAPVKRTGRRRFASQVKSIIASPVMKMLLEATTGLVVVVNENRQIVGMNDAFPVAHGISDPATVLGLRLGEALNCAHAAKWPHGCGTTPDCVTCGATIAMMEAVNGGKISEKNCTLIVEKDGATYERCLSIRAQPLKVDDNKWILIFVQDVTHQHSLTALEHVFFHDINNILSALVCNSNLLAREMPDQYRAWQIQNAAKRLYSEVTLQRFLSNQKEGAQLLKMAQVSTCRINEEVEQILYAHPESHNRKLEQMWPDTEIQIRTDVHLLSRVLGNMLLNALEATAEDGTVRLTTGVNDTHIMWEVWNDAYIPPEVQSRIFQKHFSTKASTGRGMGTHAMKLLGEKYLNGKVTFISSPENGTTFRYTYPLPLVQDHSELP